MTTRSSEFAAGIGAGVVVDQRLVPAEGGARVPQAFVHTRHDCPNLTKNLVGTYATERLARAAIPKMKACRACR